MNKFQVFIIFHKFINPSNYSVDPKFDIDYYTFIQSLSSSKNVSIPNQFLNKIILEKNFKNTNNKLHNDCYFAPATIYHFFINKLHENYDYIGFLEYDFDLQLKNKKYLTAELKTIVDEKKSGIWAFSNFHKFIDIYNQNFIKINNRNAIEQIFDDFNEFFGTDFSVKQFLKPEFYFPTQQSFFCDNKTFDSLMKFISFIIENKHLRKFSNFYHPAILMERYFGVCMLLFDCKSLNLTHLNSQEWKPRNKIGQFLAKLNIIDPC